VGDPQRAPPRDDADAAQSVQRIADRYELHELLGRGGMASVYRATDLKTGREVALKQLRLPAQAERRAGVAALFEREYHTLAQLRHPHVIAVHDYGVQAIAGPYYTMELLDGGDLRERAPLPWREACRLLLHVCSSLALLHSRRLLHRDVGPRNVRCTRDGSAKLIDFGAMGPMGTTRGQLAGTPGFIPPEAVHRSTLDARADLFSLGATLYYALTRTTAYPARNFAEVIAGWQIKPLPPSAHVPGIPAALDDLVMSLLNLEPALRPHSAFEVMQRLAAIAGIAFSEPEGVSRAYLVAPVLVGRDHALLVLRQKLARAMTGRGGGLLVRAAPGLGRSRMLDACAIEAKTLGATVLRAAATGVDKPFTVALGVTQHLLEAVPHDGLLDRFAELLELDERPAGSDAEQAGAGARCRLRPSAQLVDDPGRLQRAICNFVLTLSRAHPLVVAVDDVHRIDEPSAAVLAELVDKAHRGSLLVALTVEGGPARASQALDILARRCDELTLTPLTREHTQALLESVFGDVPNLELLTGEIHRIAHGNPRQCMDLAQHLVDRGAVQYAGGTWTLPSSLATTDLPGSAEEAIRARIAGLDPLARFLAEAQALAFLDVFSDDDYRALQPEVDSARIELAIAQLLAEQALISDGQSYTLANRLWKTSLSARLDEGERALRHRTLAAMYRGKSQMAVIHHLFAGGLDEQGLDEMISRHSDYAKGLDIRAALEGNAAAMGPSYQRAIATARKLGRPPRQVAELRRWFVALSVSSDASYYHEAAPAVLAQLEHDSGLALYRADSQQTDPNARLMSALTRAHERHQALPERERVYGVEEAIRYLAEFVACSIAIGAKTLNTPLLASLPALIEPFAPLSPVLGAIWQNSIATCESNCLCHYESACARWIEVLEKLDAATGSELQLLEPIRNAVAFAIGMLQSQFGLASAADWATRLDRDPQQKLSALYLRKIVRLEQGDWAGADRLRRQAEVAALQVRWTSMFDGLLTIEVAAHTQARDLAGLKDVIGRIEPLAARFPGWVPHLRDAEARFHLVRGDFAAAKAGFDHCIELTALDAQGRSSLMAVWVAAQAGRAEALLGLGSTQEARASAAAALATCDALGIGSHANDVVRVLALAEAGLGEFAAAAARLDALIAKQTAMGVTGLRLGLSYEARAQVAIGSGDEAAFDRYARLTAQEYRYGARCPIGVRYERLLNEARRRGLRAAAALPEIEQATLVASAGSALADVPVAVATALEGAPDAQTRAQRALQLVCDARAARGGYLYLVRPEGLVLTASHRLADPPSSLTVQAREFFTSELERSETLTVIATRGELDDALDPVSLVEISGVAYDLLLLTCVVENAGRFAGVMAVAAGEQRVRNASEAQLLAAIAAHLIQAGDTTGRAT
jgi:hypothetical protein